MMAESSGDESRTFAPRPRLEVAAYYFLAAFFALGICYSLYLIFFGGEQTSRDDRIVFTVLSIVYLPVVILIVLAVRRAPGRFQPILVGCLSPFFLGFLIAPFVLMASSKTGFTARLFLACIPLILAEAAYITVGIFTLRRGLK